MDGLTFKKPVNSANIVEPFAYEQNGLDRNKI